MGKEATDPEMIKKFLQGGGKITKGRTHTLKRNLVYNSGNHHRLATVEETETVKQAWKRVSANK